MAQPESQTEKQTGFPVISNREISIDLFVEESSGCLFVPKPPAGGLRREDVRKKKILHLGVPPPLVGGPALLRSIFEWMGACYTRSHQTLGGKDTLHFVVPEGRYCLGDWFIGQGGSISRTICEHLLVDGGISISEIPLQKYHALCERGMRFANESQRDRTRKKSAQIKE